MDKRESAIEVDDLIMQQYPSPSADGPDLSFYNGNPRDHQLDQLEQQLDQQIDPQLDARMDQQADGQLEPSGSQHQHQQDQRPIVSADELQLAAQLTQGLAPMMEAANSHEDHVLDSQDPNLQDQDQLVHGQDPSMHDQDQGLHDQDSYQHVLPHPDQSHQYAESAQQNVHLPSHLQIAQMAQQAYAAGVDHIPPRKRSKVSRACDECRRKKVKCDSVTEMGEEQCTNCRRTQSQCLFSRVPQKRGPSKGYIKELADRINSIEGKLGGKAVTADLLGLSGATPRDLADAYSPAVSLNENAKRPFSSLSVDAFSTPASNRQAPWASEPRPIHPYQAPELQRSPYTPNALAPQPIAGRTEGLASLKPAPPEADRPLAEVPGYQLQEEIDDTAFQSYLDVVHQVLPLLATNKSRLLELLAQCPGTLGEAFRSALQALAQSFQLPPPSPNPSARLANSKLAEWEAQSGPRSSIVDLVHLQTLILLAIEADNHGPTSLSGEHGGPSKTTFLARAVAIAYSMGLRSAQVEMDLDLDFDLDSERRLALRAWWTLVVLDQWNAAATGKPSLIAQDSVVLSAGLRSLLGEGPYQFTKLSYLIGAAVTVFLTSPRVSALPPGTGAALSQRVNASLEMWRVDLPPTITETTHPVVHLAYWYTRLLDYLLMPSAISTDVLWATKSAVSLLSSNTKLLSPVNHYVTCLTGLCLAELTKVDKTREAAENSITELLDADFAPSNWDVFIRQKIAEKIRPTTSSGVEATASQGLQHLADLATATELTAAATAAAAVAAAVTAAAGGDTAGASASAVDAKKDEAATPFRLADNYEDMGFDPRPMLRGGYLNILRSAG